MRPIDADALIKKYGDWYVEEGTESGFIGTLKNLLATEPTIQPQSTDLIDRQAVIDELRKFKPEIIPYEKARIYVEETVETMYDRIVELPSIQPEPQWIPCSEKLPEEAGYYITSSEYGGVTVDFYYDHFWNSRKNAYKVLAWMPLPKIYKPNK